MLPHYNLFCNKISHVRTNINVIIKLLVSYMSLLMCFISFCKCFMSLLISVLLTLYNCILWFYACAIYTYSYIIWPYTYRINKSVINLYYSCWPFDHYCQFMCLLKSCILLLFCNFFLCNTIITRTDTNYYLSWWFFYHISPNVYHFNW